MSVSSAGEKGTLPAKDFSGIDFRDGLLRVSVENQKFQKVMDEVAQKAGIEIVINGLADEDLTIHFDYLPLENGLKRLLSGRNYVFFYRSVEASQPPRLTQVLVLPKTEGETVARSGVIVENKSVNQAEQKRDIEKILNIDQQKKLEEALQDLAQGNENIREQFYEALEDMQKMKGSVEKMLEEEGIEGIRQGNIEELKDKLKVYQADQ